MASWRAKRVRLGGCRRRMPWRREVVERMRLLVWAEVEGWPMRVVRVSRRREATGREEQSC